MAVATSLVLAQYDIPCDKRRRRVAKILKADGVRVQKSAFEARLSLADRRRLVKRIERQLDLEEDRFTLYVIGKRQAEQIATLGLPRPKVDAREWWVV